MRDRGLRYWLPAYAAEALHRRSLRATRRRGLTHLFFCVCDHFEPRHGIREPSQAAERLAAWRSGYQALQKDCLDRYGLKPLHTWFYPPHHGDEHLPALARMVYEGLGEVELHYHHDGDTAASLREGLRDTLARFSRAGLLLQRGSRPGRRFGFIHGDWALDNSAGGRFCGVNGELSLLKELGCWADLTMPSANECQTHKINSIYYAVDSPERSKSHDRGEDARVGQTRAPGLLLIQGPLGINTGRPIHPRIENASLTSANWGTADRIRAWIDCHVHVTGRPEWLFIKLHTHGAIEKDFDALFGEKARRMHALLAEEYNEGRRFKLHYVTARQTFNLIRAAEHGASGEPREYLDWEVPPPAASLYCSSAPHDLACCTPERLVVEGLDPAICSTLELRYPGFVRISGQMSAVEVRANRAVVKLSENQGETPISVRLGPHQRLTELRGARLLHEGPDGDHVIACNGEASIGVAEESKVMTAGAAL